MSAHDCSQLVGKAGLARYRHAPWHEPQNLVAIEPGGGGAGNSPEAGGRRPDSPTNPNVRRETREGIAMRPICIYLFMYCSKTRAEALSWRGILNARGR